ncbi:MAG: zf-HC2 domain-containing protein [Chloroflexia bacterium]
MNQDNRTSPGPHASPQEIAALDGGLLPPGREKRLRRHLQACPRCRRQWSEVQAVRSLLRNAPRPLPPRPLTLSAKQVRSGRPVLWYPIFRTATAVVAVLVLFLFLAEPLGLVPQAATATPRPIAVKPTPSVFPSPRPAVVAPAITRRPVPTGLATLSQAPVSPSTPVEAAYPAPQPTPWIRATVSRTRVVGTPTPKEPASPALPWSLRAGGLLLLGLCLGCTWWAYRRERAFL